MKRRFRLRPEHLIRLDHVPRAVELYTRDPCIAKLLKALASQDYMGSDITPAKVEEILGCSRHQAIQTLKALGDTKVANFVVGRKGRRTRLEWGFPYGEKVAKEVIKEVIKHLNSLAEKADGDDEEAQNQLREMATAVGIREWQVENAENWAAIAKMIAPSGPGGQGAQSCEATPHDPPTEVGSVENVTAGTQNPAESRFVDTKILLRPDLWVILSLPTDLTENEAGRLAGVVRNLWLVPSNGKESEVVGPVID